MKWMNEKFKNKQKNNHFETKAIIICLFCATIYAIKISIAKASYCNHLDGQHCDICGYLKYVLYFDVLSMYFVVFQCIIYVFCL